MRLRIWTACLLLLGVLACATMVPTPPSVPLPGVVTIEAQTLPYTIKLAWDNNPAADNITNYNLIVDGVTTSISTTLCSNTGCFTQTDLTALGVHQISVTATNQFGTSPVSGCVSCSMTINLQAPLAPKNLRITQ